jgi:hypothetical protein
LKEFLTISSGRAKTMLKGLMDKRMKQSNDRRKEIDFYCWRSGWNAGNLKAPPLGGMQND